MPVKYPELRVRGVLCISGPHNRREGDEGTQLKGQGQVQTQCQDQCNYDSKFHEENWSIEFHLPEQKVNRGEIIQVFGLEIPFFGFYGRQRLQPEPRLSLVTGEYSRESAIAPGQRRFLAWLLRRYCKTHGFGLIRILTTPGRSNKVAIRGYQKLDLAR